KTVTDTAPASLSSPSPWQNDGAALDHTGPCRAHKFLTRGVRVLDRAQEDDDESDEDGDQERDQDRDEGAREEGSGREDESQEVRPGGQEGPGQEGGTGQEDGCPCRG